jgi:hypothetical protein
MQRVTEQVDATYLEQAPPRAVPPSMVVNLLSDYVFERPLRALLSPLLIAGVVALILLFLLRASPWLRLIPLLVILGWMVREAARIWRRTREDLELLRNGLLVRAHVLRLRPYRATSGTLDGALLDCAIPVAPRRTYVGSIWLSEHAEALRLANQGRVEVICLPRTPGTWRVIEEVKAVIRYDHMGPMQTLPHEE